MRYSTGIRRVIRQLKAGVHSSFACGFYHMRPVKHRKAHVTVM
jgi:hypothetical protein